MPKNTKNIKGPNINNLKNIVMVSRDRWAERPNWEYVKEYDPDDLEKCYIHFAASAIKKGMLFHKARFEWYKNGRFSKGWAVVDGKWKQRYDFKPDFIFDKTPLLSKYLKFKKSFSRKKKIINPYFIEALCSDKLKTFRLFPGLTPRLYPVKSRTELKKTMPKIRGDMAVLKPRAGSSAKGLVIDKKENILKHKIKSKDDMVLQEYIDTTKGMPGLTNSVSDLRVIMINGRFNHAFVRLAKSGLVSNVSRGGKIMFIEKQKVPKDVLKAVKSIDGKLKQYQPRIYTADFVYGSGKWWLMEMNSKPGFFFYDTYNRPDLKKRFVNALLNAIKQKIK